MAYPRLPFSPAVLIGFRCKEENMGKKESGDGVWKCDAKKLASLPV